MLGSMTASPQEASAAGPANPAEPAEPRWLSSAEEEAWKAVSALMLQLPGPLDAQLQHDSGITMFEYMVLSSLSMCPDHARRMSELARLSNGSLSRLSNVAKRLERRGWLRREPDPEDGRSIVARLTESGWKVVQAAAPGHVEAVRRLVIDPLTGPQLEALAAAAHSIVGSLEQASTACTEHIDPCTAPAGPCATDDPC